MHTFSFNSRRIFFLVANRLLLLLTKKPSSPDDLEALHRSLCMHACSWSASPMTTSTALDIASSSGKEAFTNDAATTSPAEIFYIFPWISTGSPLSVTGSVLVYQFWFFLFLDIAVKPWKYQYWLQSAKRWQDPGLSRASGPQCAINGTSSPQSMSREVVFQDLEVNQTRERQRIFSCVKITKVLLLSFQNHP
jgi:hypothetical protein